MYVVLSPLTIYQGGDTDVDCVAASRGVQVQPHRQIQTSMPMDGGQPMCTVPANFDVHDSEGGEETNYCEGDKDGSDWMFDSDEVCTTVNRTTIIIGQKYY